METGNSVADYIRLKNEISLGFIGFKDKTDEEKQELEKKFDMLKTMGKQFKPSSPKRQVGPKIKAKWDDRMTVLNEMLNILSNAKAESEEYNSNLASLIIAGTIGNHEMRNLIYTKTKTVKRSACSLPEQTWTFFEAIQLVLKNARISEFAQN